MLGVKVLRSGIILLALFFVVCCAVTSAHAKTVHTGLFGIYAWGDWPQALDITRNNGFDIVVDASNKNALDMCQARGLKSIVGDFKFSADMNTDEVKWQQFLAGVREKVTALKDHPAVFAWYLLDEPDWQQVPLSKIKEMNALVRSIDKKHPIMTVFTIPKKWTPYLPYYDIVSIDPYLRKNTLVPDKPEKVREWITKIRRDLKTMKLVKPVWVTLGAFDLIPKTSAYTNEFIKPTPEQFNQMADISIAEGVDGILVWTFGIKNNARYKDWTLINDEPALWEAVRKLPAKLK